MKKDLVGQNKVVILKEKRNSYNFFISIYCIRYNIYSIMYIV